MKSARLSNSKLCCPVAPQDLSIRVKVRHWAINFEKIVDEEFTEVCINEVAKTLELESTEKEYGLDADEAIEYAYDNVILDAKRAIKGKRRPKS